MKVRDCGKIATGAVAMQKQPRKAVSDTVRVKEPLLSPTGAICLMRGWLTRGPDILCRGIFANFLPTQVDFGVCRIPLNICATFELTNRVQLLEGDPADYAYKYQRLNHQHADLMHPQ